MEGERKCLASVSLEVSSLWSPRPGIFLGWRARRLPSTLFRQPSDNKAVFPRRWGRLDWWVKLPFLLLQTSHFSE